MRRTLAISCHITSALTVLVLSVVVLTVPTLAHANIASTDTTPAQQAPTIEQFTLKNGLEVIVVPNHRVPAVNHTLWYFVGAGDDPAGKSGLAHYHEHSMFLGTPKHASGQYSEIITRHGGEQNAFTGHDATAYFINIAKEYLPLAMEMEADRMGAMALSDVEMEKEKQVIIEERRMRIDNNPDALLSEQVQAALFRNHPYHTPVIGWQHEMETLTKQDVIAFHKRWYHPNNAVLIIGGDVTAAEVRPLAEKYYGHFPRVALPTRHWTQEPPQRAERRLTLHHAQVKKAEWSRSYAAASLNVGTKEDTLPLLVLAQVLGGGKTSRLYQSLVTQQRLAADVSVSYNGFARGPGEFTIAFVPQEGVEAAQVETALDHELAQFLQSGITTDELKRAKTLLKAETIYARDGLSSVANLIGWLRMVGMQADYFTRWPQMVETISAETVLTAARHTLKREQCVTALLLPPEVSTPTKPASTEPTPATGEAQP